MDPATLAPQLARKRCIVYVDGFNWYYGIFIHRPQWKWLNIQTFFEELRSDEDIIAVKFFTAWVGKGRHLNEPRDRQTSYYSALDVECKKVNKIFGDFKEKTVVCRAECQKSYRIPGEKKTDVNIAVNLIDDALNGTCDVMVLVSADSDLEPAVKWVLKHGPKIKFVVYIPTFPANYSDLPAGYAVKEHHAYSVLPVNVKLLPLDSLAVHQLPNPVIKGNREIKRAASWV